MDSDDYDDDSDENDGNMILCDCPGLLDTRRFEFEVAII
jgi:hypothetical protein